MAAKAKKKTVKKKARKKKATKKSVKKKTVADLESPKNLKEALARLKTDKQRVFVQEYLIDLNATQAAIRAGYSEKTAYSIGQRLLKHVEILTAIQFAMEARSEQTGIDANWVLIRLARLVDANLDDLLVRPEGGHPYYDLSKASREQIGLLEGLDLETVVENDGKKKLVVVRKVKVRLPSKLKGLELAGRYVGLEKMCITGEVVHVNMTPEEYKKAREEALSDDNC